MGSVELEKELEKARQDLQLKEKVLLEQKDALINEVRVMLPNAIDRAVKDVISRNVPRIDAMAPDILKKMKAEIEAAKPNVAKQTVSSLQSFDWRWCGPLHTENGSDPIGFFGVNEQGPIWKAVQSYGDNVRSILERYNLQVEDRTRSYARSPFYLTLPKTYHGQKESFQEANEAFGKLHKEYCENKCRVADLESQLKIAQASEKYDSA